VDDFLAERLQSLFSPTASRRGETDDDLIEDRIRRSNLQPNAKFMKPQSCETFSCAEKTTEDTWKTGEHIANE
jgi:hypothetical protein